MFGFLSKILGIFGRRRVAVTRYRTVCFIFDNALFIVEGVCHTDASDIILFYCTEVHFIEDPEVTK